MKLKTLRIPVALALSLISISASAELVYFDNSSKQWSQPYIYFWGGTPNSWPGDPMIAAGIDEAPDLWCFDVPEDNTKVIFNNNSEQTADLPLTLGNVYNFEGSVGSLASYLHSLNGGEVAPQDGRYTIWFDNTEGCSDIHAWIWDENDGDRNYTGGTWPGAPLVYDAAKKLYYYSFTCNAENPALKIIICSNTGNAHQTNDLDLFNDWVYTHDGAIAPLDEYTVAQSSYPLGQYESYSSDGTTVSVNCSKGTLFITPFSPQLVKIFTLPSDAAVTEERESISVVLQPEVAFEISENDSELIVAVADGVTVAVNKETATVEFRDADGRVILAEDKGLRNNSGSRRISFLPMNDAAFYGGGYNGGWTNWQGHSMVMNNTQTGNWTSYTNPPHCINIPFYISSNGYGVYFDDHYRNATITPSASGSSYSSSSQNPIAYYFVGGPSMEDVIANYTLLTGRQAMPAYWGLGYITSRYGYRNRAEGEEAVNNIKQMPLPLDAIVFDLYWQGDDEYHLGTLDWGSNFPNPTEMMQNFKDKNVHTICITEPYFTHLCPNYNTLRDNGYFADESVDGMEWLHSNQVGLIDASNPDAMEWMAGFYKDRTREGIDGWWMDLGEPERHDGDSHHQGGSVNQIHNEFSLLWQRAIHNSLQAEFPDRRLLLMPRSGTSGMQHYAAFPWTGDIQRSWPGLAAQVPALVNSSMSGIGYMGSDVGGFIVNDFNPNLYLRWIEFAVFSPAMRTHSQGTCGPEPYLDAYSSVANGVKKFINLRYKYLPYLYNLAYAFSYEGRPLARPANFNDADPSRLANCTDAYLWGRDMFIAPVLENATTRSISFPDGRWIDMNNWTDIYDGGADIYYPAPLDCLPHFARLGSFIPSYTESTFTSTAEASRSDFTIHYIFDPLNPDARGYLYEDDHADPKPVENDNYTLTEFNATVDDNGLGITISRSGTTHSESPGLHNYTIIVHNYEMPVGASVFGTSFSSAPARAVARAPRDLSHEFAPAASADDLASAEGNAFFYDPSSKKLHLRISAAPTENFVVSANSNGVLTDIDNLAGEALLSLSYADGLLSYAVPDNFSDASISFWNPTGVLAASFDHLAIDGLVHQQSISLPAGVYFARIDARNNGGAQTSKSIKLIVR
ncbi:MAG: starch-binding protein [Muribaculaceae bacterium]|nr:starch-binding protein [Muribaculaceae bacterium]